MSRAVRCLLACVALTLVGCGQPEEPGFVAKTVPSCASISRFGSGLRCDNDAGLGGCGVGAAGLCASGWLCFDRPELAFCACETDADCQGRAAYINTARAAKKVAPMAARCALGRCQGAP